MPGISPPILSTTRSRASVDSAPSWNCLLGDIEGKTDGIQHWHKAYHYLVDRCNDRTEGGVHRRPYAL